jgi:hypothetical protein
MKLIIDIPEQDFHRVCQGYIDYSNNLDGRCLAAISEGTPIHDNATNSYVMLTMFPNETDLHTFARHKKVVWWNAPYKS